MVIDKSPENIERLKKLAENHTLREAGRLAGISAEGIRDFLVRHNALPENRKVKYKRPFAKLYTVPPKKCLDCGKELFWNKIYYKEVRCQKCGYKKYFDELRASKPPKVKKVRVMKIKPIKLKIRKQNPKKSKTDRSKIKLEKLNKEINERIAYLQNQLKKHEKELDFVV